MDGQGLTHLARPAGRFNLNIKHQHLIINDFGCVVIFVTLSAEIVYTTIGFDKTEDDISFCTNIVAKRWSIEFPLIAIKHILDGILKECNKLTNVNLRQC